MSDYSTNSTINLSVNGKSVEEKLNKYEKQLVQLRQTAQRAAEIGDKGTLKKTQSEIIKIENQIRKVRTATANVEETLKNLDKARPNNLKKDLQVLKNQLNGLERGSDAWNAHVEKIKLVQAELKKVNSELKEGEGFWDKFNRKMNDWQTTIAAGAAAVTGLVMAGRSAVKAYADMDAELANVRKFTGMTAEQVDDLNEEFKKIDTRTSREDLNKLAEEAGRLGKTSKEDVLGFVEAADKINVALDDLGEGATLTLSKLTNIFGDEKIYGTEDSLLKVGSVINELSQNCTASAPYLAEFAQRLAGVGAQAGMTIPQIMSFAAVLDSQGQAVEMSATALSKLIMDLFKDPAKIAKATGLDLDELNKKLKESTNGGLMMLLDQLHNIGNMDVLAPVFADMGEDGARASAVIAALAGNIDTLKWEQEEANKAYKEGTSVVNEFNVQNTTVQAGLDKAKKSLSETAIELGEKLMPIMSHVISSTSLLLKLLNTVTTFVINNISLIATITASIAAYTIAVNASNIAFKAHYAWLVATKYATVAYHTVAAALKDGLLLLNIAMAKLNGNTARQSALMLDLKRTTTSLTAGLGILAAAATIVIGLLIKRKQEQDALHEKEIQEMNDEREKMKAYSDEYAKITSLNKILHDNTKSYDDRKKALDILKQIVPDYHADLKKEGELINDNKEALDKYLESFKEATRAKANQEKYEKLIKEELELEEERDKAEKDYWDKKQTNTLQGTGNSISGRIAKKVGGWLGLSGTEGEAKNRLDDVNKRLAENRAKQKEIEPKIKPSTNTEKTTDTNGGGGGDGGGYTPSNSKSSEDKLKAEKEWKAKQEALNRIAYATGEKDYEAYQQRIIEIDEEYQAKVLKHSDLSENELLEAKASYYEDLKKLDEKENQSSLEDVNEYYKELVAIENQRYVDGKVDNETYTESLKQIELKRKRDIVAIYKEGSKERKDAEDAYQTALMNDQIEHHKKFEEKEKEHQKKLDEIKKSVFGNSDQQNKVQFQEELNLLNEVYNKELAACQNNADEKLRIEEAYQKAKAVLAEKYGQVTAENGFNQMQVANSKLTKWLESDNGKAVVGAYDTITSGMSSIFSQMSSLVQSECEIQTAAIEARYDKEISAAEGNQYKVNKLEKKKEEETAKVKNEANKKMYTMQIMQAIAQTATAALNAYSSAAAVPVIGYILAPIAAAMATASGLLQVAAIKKQQQASEASGYAEGGYTKQGSKYEPAGVVHAGEWVASQALLANPTASAIIKTLDYAQKTNTIGSIKPMQVSEGNIASAVVARSADNYSAYDDSRINRTLNTLNNRLKDPFVTVNTVEGDNGIKKAQDEYEKMIKNKTPKSRR